MPWRASYENPLLNPRLAPYRHQLAEFRDANGEVGTIYVEPELMSPMLGGHLWWRKWGPAREQVILWIEDPAIGLTDALVGADALDAEIDQWERGEFHWVGEVCSLTWLGDRASREKRQELSIDDPSDS